MTTPAPGRTATRGPRRTLEQLARRRASWCPDEAPALYVYEQASPDGHVQRGLLGALALTPPEDEIVLPHENTMAGPVSDRLALYTAVDADLEPIFLVYDGGGAASAAVASVGGAGGSDAAGAPGCSWTPRSPTGCATGCGRSPTSACCRTSPPTCTPARR